MFDRKVKLPLYAKAGIPVVWIVNLKQKVVEVYSEPVDGTYRQHRIMRRGETLTLESVPHLSLSVDDLF